MEVGSYSLAKWNESLQYCYLQWFVFQMKGPELASNHHNRLRELVSGMMATMDVRMIGAADELELVAIRMFAEVVAQSFAEVAARMFVEV